MSRLISVVLCSIPEVPARPIIIANAVKNLAYKGFFPKALQKWFGSFKPEWKNQFFYNLEILLTLRNWNRFPSKLGQYFRAHGVILWSVLCKAESLIWWTLSGSLYGVVLDSILVTADMYWNYSSPFSWSHGPFSTRHMPLHKWNPCNYIHPCLPMYCHGYPCLLWVPVSSAQTISCMEQPDGNQKDFKWNYYCVEAVLLQCKAGFSVSVRKSSSCAVMD